MRRSAANLAWKLAAELQGWAPRDLLDTYESERHAFGRRVFMQTQAQTALMAPGPDVTAVRELLSELLTRRENVQVVADLMAGADVRLDMGAQDRAAATGWFAPELDLTTPDGRAHHLPELRHDARPLLLDLSGGTELAAVAAPWSDRVDHVRARAGTDAGPPSSSGRMATSRGPAASGASSHGRAARPHHCSAQGADHRCRQSDGLSPVRTRNWREK